jgi:drug/metabolite transporter (DMT)-like permease
MPDPQQTSEPRPTASWDRPIRLSDLAVYVIIVLFWGGSFYGIEFQLGTVPVEVSIFYRYVVAAIILIGICVVTRRSLFRFSFADHRLFMLLGLLFFSFNYVLIYRAQLELTSGLTAITFTMALFFTTLNERIFLKHRFRPQIIIGGLIGVAGLALIFGGSVIGADFSRGTLTGLIFILAGAYVVSLATIATARLNIRQVPPIQANAWSMTYGAIFNGLFVLAFGHELTMDWSVSYVVSFLYLTILSSVVAFILFFILVQRIGPSRSAYFTLLSPMVAILISVYAENLPVTLALVGGVVAILFGNYIAIRPSRKA